MTSSANINWPRIAAEGAAIVASILFAFAIDAWWEDRQVRQEEQQILQGLREEFVSIRDVLSLHYAEHLERLQSLEQLLFVLDDGPGDDVGPVVEAALLDMLWPSTSDIGNGTLEALLNSGRVEILASKRLRARLAAWEGVIGEVWDDQNDNARMVYETYIPFFVSENVAAGTVMRHWYDEWPIPGRSIADDPVAIKRLLDNPRFRLLTEIRYGYKRHLSEEFEAAIAAADVILSEIEQSSE